MVVLSTVRLVATGAIVGLLGTLITVRYLDSLLFGVSAFDLPAFGAALAAMGVVAVVAALAPALRAARVNPVTVMRAE